MSIKKKTTISIFNKDCIKIESQEASEGVAQNNMDQNPEEDTIKANMDLNSPAVTASMTIYCHIINRLAGNSNVCKTISIALAGAYIGFKMQPHLIIGLIIIAVILCLMALDSLYIGLKDNTNEISQNILQEVIKGDSAHINPFNMNEFNKLKIDIKNRHPKHSKTMYNCRLIKDGFKSISVWLFYSVIIVGIILAFFFGHSDNTNSMQNIVNYIS